MRVWWIVVGFCLLTLSGLWGETRAYFSSQESVEKILVHHIEESHASIEMALFEFRSPALRQALDRALVRGVSVHLILDASRPVKGNATPVSARWLGGKRLGGRGVMHNKFALFDHACVITGSYNWTPGAEYANFENVLVVDDPAVVLSFAQEFDALWRLAGERPRSIIPPAPSSFGFSRSKKQSRAQRKRAMGRKIILRRASVRATTNSGRLSRSGKSGDSTVGKTKRRRGKT